MTRGWPMRRMSMPAARAVITIAATCSSNVTSGGNSRSYDTGRAVGNGLAVGEHRTDIGFDVPAIHHAVIDGGDASLTIDQVRIRHVADTVARGERVISENDA